MLKEMFLKKTVLSPKSFLILLFLSLGSIHLGIVILNHYYYRTSAFDYGVYNFAFYDFAHFRVSPCPVYISSFPITFLQDHFSLSLVILSPLYWLLAPVFGTYSLLIIQWAFIMLGAWFTHKCVALKTTHLWISGAAMLYFFILYSRFSSYQNDCNLAILGSALVPVFFYAFEARKTTLLVATFIFLSLNREDFSLGLLFLCLLLAWLHRTDKAQMRRALILAGVSLLWFIVVFKLVIPFLEDENKRFSLFNYSALGKTPSEAFLFLMSHPLQTLKMLFVNHTANAANDGVKMEFYLIYFISGGFILLYRPVYLVALIPLFAKKMFNDDAMRWSHELYHGVEVASLIPIMVFTIVADLRHSLLKKSLVFLICSLTLIVTIHGLLKSDERYFGFSKFNILSKKFFQPECDVKTVREVLTEIPDSCAVSASVKLLPHLAFRKKIYYFPVINDAEYVCIYRNGDTYPFTKEQFNVEVEKIVNSSEWHLLSNKNGLLLLHKSRPVPKNSP